MIGHKRQPLVERCCDSRPNQAPRAGGKLKLAATLGNEPIKRPVGNHQRLSSRIGLAVIAFICSYSKIDL
jgi:hypothetical protein